MDFHVEPDFVHRPFEPRYFVRPLDENESSYTRGNRWEIQFLNDSGQGAANLEFGPNDPLHHFDLLAIRIPQAVIEAAKEGDYAYLDSNGQHRADY